MENDTKTELCVVDDPHIHYPYLRDEDDLYIMMDTIHEKVDRTAITSWAPTTLKTFGISGEYALTYQELVEALKEDGYDIDIRDVVTIVNHMGKKIQVYKSQEIRTNSHLHITAEGCLDLIPDFLDPRKTIELVHKQGGIAIIEHMCIKDKKILQHWYTNKEEDKLTKEVLKDYADAGEVFNSYVCLWMNWANRRAKILLDEINEELVAEGKERKTAYAGSDTHFDDCEHGRLLCYNNIARAHMLFPEHDIQSLTGREIIDLKKKDLREGNYELVTRLTGPYTFFFTIAMGRIRTLKNNCLERLCGFQSS